MNMMYHFVVSAILVLVSFTLLRLSPCVRWVMDDCLFAAAIVAVAVGLIQEIMEGLYNDWPWCGPTCSFDLWDLAAILNGALLAVLVLLVGSIVLQKHEERQFHDNNNVGDNDTEASTTISDNEHNDVDALEAGFSKELNESEGVKKEQSGNENNEDEEVATAVTTQISLPVPAASS